MEFTITPLAVPGCTLLPWKVTVASRALHVSSLIAAERAAVHRVGEPRAELGDVELLDAAADLLVGRERHGDRPVRDVRDSARAVSTSVMIAATPALSSEPSSVVPSVVMMSSPIIVRQHRILRHGDDLRWIAGQHDVAALIVRVDHGLARWRRVTAGEVSTWAMNPITGTRPWRRLPGMRA